MRTWLLLTSALLLWSCASNPELQPLPAKNPLPLAITKAPPVSTEGSFTLALERLLDEQQIELAILLQKLQNGLEADLRDLLGRLSNLPPPTAPVKPTH